MSSIDLTKVKLTIHDWLKLASPTDLPVIEARPNADRPFGPYITYDLTVPSISLGQPDITYSGTGTAFNITNQKMMFVTVMVLGTDESQDLRADQIAVDLEASLQVQQVRDILCEGGLAVFNTPQISNVSVEIESGFEERYALEVNFGVGSQITDDSLGCIEKVEDAEGTISGGVTGDKIETFTVVKP